MLSPHRIFRDPQLKNMQISFAMWHFTCTSIVLYIASRSPFNLFVPVRLPFLQMIPLCSFFAGFLILGNLSLAYNSIGFYQYVVYVAMYSKCTCEADCVNN
jgi:solute carrier family 35 protein E3